MFDQALSAATYKYLTTGEFIDNIFKANKYLGLLKQYGAYDSVDGGVRLVESLMYGTNPSVTSANYWDTIAIVETDEFTSADYPWAQVHGALALSKGDIARNSGESQKINLIEAKRKNLEMSIQQNMNGQLFTGNAVKPTNVLGLDQLVEATGAVGNIDSSAQAWWRSTVNSTSTALSETLMESAFLSAYQNIKAPDLMLTTQALYGKYMDLTRGKLQVQIPSTKIAELGFEMSNFKGKPVLYDLDCASGDMYFLNFDNLKLRYHKDYNFEVSPQAEMPAQHVFAWKIFWFGNQTVNNRRMLARLRAKTVS